MAGKKEWERFNFPSEDDWNKLNKQTRKHIKDNGALWENLNKDIGNVKDQIKLLSGMTDDSVKSLSNFSDISKGIVSSFKEIYGSGRDLTTVTNSLNISMAKTASLSKKNTVLSKKSISLIQNVAKGWQDVIENVERVGTENFSNLDLTEDILEAQRLGLKNEELSLRMAKEKQNELKRINDVMGAQRDLIQKPFDAMDDMIRRIPIFGDVIASKLDFKTKGKDLANDLVSSMSGSTGDVLNWNEFQKKKAGQDLSKTQVSEQYAEHKKGISSAKKGTGKLGIGAIAVGTAIAGWAVSTFNFARELGVGFGELNAGALLFKEETKAVLDEFGSLRDVSNSLLFSMKWQAFWSGAQAADLAKVMMLQESITGLSKEQASEQNAKWMKEFINDGLAAGKVMADIASHADLFADYAKDGGENMKEAAKQAAGMGLSLDATASVADKLLDWESSIAAEMEASVLLGRQINFDKARQLAYSGDLAAMMKEVKIQAGGEAEFAKMSVVQRRSLGDAIGLSGANLAEFMKTESEATEQSKRGWMLKFGIIVGTLTAVGALLGFILGGLAPGRLVKAGIGAAWGAGIGLGMGTLAAGAITKFQTAGDVMSPAKGKTQISTKEGGLYNLSKNDDVMAAPNLMGSMNNQQQSIVNID
ncbi:MAG: hypothetical protein HOI55_00205, partial [Candidatus Marinimicrobia bacterium]|nr:hypothetical protein [Candidatus Neomarinimicrobiota bacterium]